MKDDLLNISLIEYPVRTLGPGNRFGIWVQGCPFNCKNCVSPETIPFKKNHLMAIKDLVKEIMQYPKLDGLTISGGEPMMQAKRLKTLITILKQLQPTLDVIVYTGFNLPDLVWEDAKLFLKEVDVLIAGIYIDKLNDNKGLRGSSNQKIHFLTNQLKPYESLFYHANRTLDFTIKEEHLQMIGIPHKDFSLTTRVQ